MVEPATGGDSFTGELGSDVHLATDTDTNGERRARETTGTDEAAVTNDRVEDELLEALVVLTKRGRRQNLGNVRQFSSPLRSRRFRNRADPFHSEVRSWEHPYRKSRRSCDASADAR